MISWTTIKLLIYDFDGVMTDNTAYVSQDGHEMVKVNRSDGLAIKELKKAGYAQMIISTEENPVVSMRAKKLGIPVIQSCKDKLSAVKQVCDSEGVSPQNVVFIGNDMNDLEAMNYVGTSISPNDGYPLIRSSATCVTEAKGGEGVIRELYESYLKTQ
jgi:N-acylneuraminate cytidylyltransferase/3-deoxy-D-manno-octulosonate 8-phosphate phosphatase (KDO 8-P phosphatase)